MEVDSEAPCTTSSIEMEKRHTTQEICLCIDYTFEKLEAEIQNSKFIQFDQHEYINVLRFSQQNYQEKGKNPILALQKNCLI